MKILHTADWHLGDRLGRIDRTDDLRKAVERIAGYCKSEKVDVLLVAGDLFSELARPDGLRDAIDHLQDVFREFLQTGGTILTITGNHDNENFCQTLVHAMTLAAPGVGRVGDTIPPGRLYLAADPTFIHIPNRAGGTVQFVLMPYPTPTRFLTGGASRKYSSPDEKNRLIADGWSRALADLRAHPKFDATVPAVLSAHVHVYGSTVGPSLFRLTEEEDVIVGGQTWAESYAYVALGHIHKPQTLGGASHVRYSGSIERMDLGEQADHKGVIVFEIGPKGLVGEPEVLPLPATPIREIAILNPPEDLPKLRAEYAEAKDDLLNLHVTYTAGRDSLEEVLRELNEIFPRWYARDWHESGALGPSLADPDAARAKGFAETVRDYINEELIQHSPTDRDAILALAEELMKEVNG